MACISTSGLTFSIDLAGSNELALVDVINSRLHNNIDSLSWLIFYFPYTVPCDKITNMQKGLIFVLAL